jgi:sulfonate transport system permease protein
MSDSVISQRWSRRTILALDGLIAPLALLVVWWVGSTRGWMPEQVLPPPDAVASALADLWNSGDLTTNALISLRRVVVGFAVGTAAGIVLGTAMGLSRRTEEVIRPFFTAAAQVPAIGWIPLMMLVAGIGEPLKIIVIAVAACVPVTLNTLAGARAVPRGFYEVASVFRYNHRQILWRVVLPASVPQVFTGLRFGLTNAWLALVAVELLASSEGLGYLLVWGRQMFQLDLVLAVMLVIGVVGFALDAGLAFIERRLQRWQTP